MVDVDAPPRRPPPAQTSPTRSARLVLGGALVAFVVVAVVFVLNLSTTAPRLAGVSATRLDAFSTVVKPNAEVCQLGESVPADAASVSLVVDTYGTAGQPLGITLRDRRGTRRASVGATYASGTRVTAPLSGPAHTSGSARLCVRNRGRRPIALGGIADADKVAAASRIRVRDRIAVSWYRSGRPSWWAIAPTVAQRAGRVKARWIGTWTIWTSLAAIFVAGVLAVWTVARSARG